MQAVQAPPSQLDIYRASAGSGKTFLLVNQYLRLLLQSETSYREILAVTFTNRATAEMRHRILSELQCLATGKQSKHIAILIKEAEGLTEEALRRHAASVYSNILHDYSRFTVTTIDSFVQKIIRSFAYEIGLDDGFRLQMNEEVVKEDLAERLYNLLDANKPLRQWVTELAIERLSSGKNWDFKADMLELAGELFKERFNGFDEAMKPLSEEDKAAAFKQLRSSVYASINAFEKRQEALAKEALDLLEINGLDPADFNYGKAGFINHFFKASKRDFCAPGSRVLAILDNPEKMPAGKLPAAKKEAVISVCERLHKLLTALVAHYTDHFEKYNTAKAIAANLYTLQLMQVFVQELANYRSENNMLLISDANILLRKLSAENDASFIFEKMGSRYRHFLIDEFQDTSVFQWDNFRPLLENALGDGKYNLLVGDVKQSIYRWRSGDWRLLHTGVKKELGHQPIQNGTLQDNHRSARPVIEFNNYLFHVLPRRLQAHFNGQMQEAPLDIQAKLEAQNYFGVIEAAYNDSFQQMPASAAPQGSVQIEFIQEQEDSEGAWRSFETEVLYRLPRKIEQLMFEGGYNASQITILTRNNSEARAVIQSLIDYQQQTGTIEYDVLSADALYLDSNESIQVLLAAIRWLSNPQDTISKAFIIQTWEKNLGGNVSSHHIYEGNAKNDGALPLELINGRTVLHNLPMLELVNRLIELLNLHRIPSGHAYLLAFQDVVLDWVRFGKDGLQAFIEYWDEEGYKKALPASGGNAVEVMTIHKAKGLAFDVLIVPFCNWPLDPDAKKNNWLWVQTEGSGFHDIPVVPVKYKKDMSQSHFAFQYFEEQLLSRMDALNLLYVAFTRARKQIIGYAPLPFSTSKKETPIRTIGDLMYDVLSNSHSAEHPQIPAIEEAFEDNILTYGQLSETITTTVDKVDEVLSLSDMVYGRWQNQLRIRPAALQQEEETVSLPRRREALLQSIISKLQRPTELPVLLQQMERQGLMEPIMKKEVASIMQKLLQHPLLQPWGEGKLQKVGAQNMLVTKEFIRRPGLILSGENETLVLDFIFLPAADTIRLQVQLNSYVRLLEQMQFKNVKGFLLDGLKGDVLV